jgi:hypothetical protein
MMVILLAPRIGCKTRKRHETHRFVYEYEMVLN